MRQANLGLDLTTKRTRKREFLDEMNRVVPWGELVALISPHALEGKRGRPPFPVEMMLRIHFMQQWWFCRVKAGEVVFEADKYALAGR